LHGIGLAIELVFLINHSLQPSYYRLLLVRLTDFAAPMPCSAGNGHDLFGLQQQRRGGPCCCSQWDLRLVICRTCRARFELQFRGRFKGLPNTRLGSKFATGVANNPALRFCFHAAAQINRQMAPRPPTMSSSQDIPQDAVASIEWGIAASRLYYTNVGGIEQRRSIGVPGTDRVRTAQIPRQYCSWTRQLLSLPIAFRTKSMSSTKSKIENLTTADDLPQQFRERQCAPRPSWWLGVEAAAAPPSAWHGRPACLPS